MTRLPELGLGAAALAWWLTDNGRRPTWLASQVEASDASVHGWLHAGWLEGGTLPDALNRKAIERLTNGDVPTILFDLDHARRRAHRRAGKGRPSLPVPAPEAA